MKERTTNTSTECKLASIPSKFAFIFYSHQVHNRVASQPLPKSNVSRLRVGCLAWSRSNKVNRFEERKKSKEKKRKWRTVTSSRSHWDIPFDLRLLSKEQTTHRGSRWTSSADIPCSNFYLSHAPSLPLKRKKKIFREPRHRSSVNDYSVMICAVLAFFF